VFAAVVLSQVPARAQAPTPAPAQIDEARRLFKVGVALLEDPEGAKYDEARVQFQKAYDLSGNWKILANLGVCQLKLERDGEAIASYEKYLAGGGANIDAEEKAQIERDLAVLKAQVVTVNLTLPAAGAITDERLDSRGNKMINEYQAPGQTLTLGLHPGDHTLTARLPNGTAKWEANLAPASQASHTFEVVPEPAAAPVGAVAPGAATPAADQGAPAGEGERPIPTTVWIGAGVTGALTIGAVVTGAIALGKRSDFNAINDSTHSETEKQSAHDSAASMGLVSTVLSAGALVGAGVTTYLFFSRPTAPTKEQQARTILAPWIAPGGGGLAVGGAL
jgi:hypothetical protein